MPKGSATEKAARMPVKELNVDTKSPEYLKKARKATLIIMERAKNNFAFFD